MADTIFDVPVAQDKANRDILDGLWDEIQDIRNSLGGDGGVLVGEATVDAASLADAAGSSHTVTVTGAALGDFVLCSLGVSAAGMTVTGYVSAADTVTIRLQNESGGAVDLASTTFRALVIKSTAIALLARRLSKT